MGPQDSCQALTTALSLHSRPSKSSKLYKQVSGEPCNCQWKWRHWYIKTLGLGAQSVASVCNMVCNQIHLTASPLILQPVNQATELDPFQIIKAMHSQRMIFPKNVYRLKVTAGKLCFGLKFMPLSAQESFCGLNTQQA